jgi:hypothetical protein
MRIFIASNQQQSPMTLVTIPLLLEAGCIWCTDASTTTVTDDDDEHFPITIKQPGAKD